MLHDVFAIGRKTDKCTFHAGIQIHRSRRAFSQSGRGIIYIGGTLVVLLLGSRVTIDSNGCFLYSALFHPVDSSCSVLDGPIESHSPIEKFGLSSLYDELTLLVYTVTHPPSYWTKWHRLHFP